MHLWITLPALMAFIFVALQSQYAVDLWPHLNLGRQIVEQGRLPDSVDYSYRAIHQTVTDQAWLGQVVLYGLYHAGGRELVQFAVALLYATGIGLLTVVCWRRSRSVYPTVFVVLSSLVLAASNISVRTQVFSFFCFQLASALLWLWPERRAWPFLAYAVLQVLWANVHGAFPLGVILPGVFLAGRCLEVCEQNGPRALLTDRLLRRWLTVTFVALAMCFVVPAPGEMIGYILGLVGRAQSRGITEWQANSVTEFTGAVFFLSVAAVILLLSRMKSSLGWREVLMLAVFFLLGVRATRMVVWWGSVSATVLAPSLLLPKRFRSTDATCQPESPAFNRATALVFLTFVALATPWTRQWNPLLSASRRLAIPADEPAEAVSFLRQQQFSGRLFSRMEWGAYAAWHLPGSGRIHLDAMIDFYPDVDWFAYQCVVNAVTGWEDVLANDNVDAVLLAADESQIVEQLRSSADWTEAWSDSVALVFFRTRPSDNSTKNVSTNDVMQPTRNTQNGEVLSADHLPRPRETSLEIEG